MALEEFKNPKTRKTEYIVSGVVSAIYFNELKVKKDYGKEGKSWVPTHSVNIVVDGDKVGLGLTDKEVIRVKDADENYHDLVKGIEITVPVNVGEYNGKPQYNGFSSGITVVGTDGVAKAQESQSSGFKQPYTASKRDNSGVSTGHALNGALNLVRGVEGLDYTEDSVVELATLVHKITSEMKEEYAKENPDMSEYDVGAAVGHAVLNATRDVEEASEKEIREHAQWVLNSIVPRVLEVVKAKPEAKVTPKKTVAKKTAAKKTTRNEATPERVNDADIPDSAYEDTNRTNLADMDDDIPF